MLGNSYEQILKNNGYIENNPNNVIFIPQFEEVYWYVERWNFNHINDNEKEHVYCDKRRSYETNDLVFIINRCFKTKEEAEDYYQFLIAEATLKLAIIKINNGWTPNWNNRYTEKFYIYSDKNRKVLDCDCSFVINQKSKEDSIFYLKDKASAKLIINEYQKELKKYFGITNE